MGRSLRGYGYAGTWTKGTIEYQRQQAYFADVGRLKAQVDDILTSFEYGIKSFSLPSDRTYPVLLGQLQLIRDACPEIGVHEIHRNAKRAWLNHLKMPYSALDMQAYLEVKKLVRSFYSGASCVVDTTQP